MYWQARRDSLTQKSLEAIRNEVGPELEVGALIVAGVHRILDDHLPEVGVLISGYRTEEGLRHFLGNPHPEGHEADERGRRAKKQRTAEGGLK